VTGFSLERRLAAEAIGTGLVVTTVVGSGIMASRLAQDVGPMLPGNTIPTGAILVVLILMLGPVSGAHFNPAVSLVMAMRKRLPWGELPSYAIAQIVGGIAGTMAAHLMFDQAILQASNAARAGIGQHIAEGVATGGLVLAVSGVLRFRPDAMAAAVGLYCMAVYWFTASMSFANPAVTIARSLTDSFAGVAAMDAPAFLAIQAVAAVGAALLAGWLFTVGSPAPGPEETAGRDVNGFQFWGR
jgi:glycerol uptake facilitator-like aquaporin